MIEPHWASAVSQFTAIEALALPIGASDAMEIPPLPSIQTELYHRFMVRSQTLDV